MTKSQSMLFRLLLFLAGAGIIVLAFFLIHGKQEPELAPEIIFMWVSIGVIYLVLFLPFLLAAINIGSFSKKIPVISLMWVSIPLYLAASIIVIVLLFYAESFTLNAGIITQSVLLLLLFVMVYLAYFASSHVSSVAGEEAAKQRNISQLKPKAQSLLLSVHKLPPEYAKAQTILKQAIDDIRYIYPVDNGAGDNLESQIMQSLNIISEICSDLFDGAQTASLESEAEKLRMLVKERKLLRN